MAGWTLIICFLRKFSDTTRNSTDDSRQQHDLQQHEQLQYGQQQHDRLRHGQTAAARRPTAEALSGSTSVSQQQCGQHQLDSYCSSRDRSSAES